MRWLVVDYSTSGWDRPAKRVPFSEPCPTIHAERCGIAGQTDSYWWIEDDGVAEPEADAKPPYRVPSMAEIRAVEPNGLSVVSTFSGCGGSCLGLKMCGYRVLWASEFVPAAAETYRLNHPGVPLATADVREVEPEQILAETGLKAGELDLLEGSPPCASFSTAGKGAAHWGEVKAYSDRAQRTDDLFFEYARLLAGLRPRAFIAENVAGLARGVAKGYFKRIHAALVECGYRVEARMLDAQWLGVPQVRRRIIFVGVREDLGLAPAFPSPLPYRYSIRDALPWIVRQASNAPYGKTGWNDAGEHPSQTIGAGPSSGNGLSPPSVVEAYVEIDSKGMEGARTFSADEPIGTVRAGGGGGHQTGYRVTTVTHPTEKRKFTIAELRRLCGFPDDFQLTGSYSQQWERLGRAVPPPMMRAVGDALAREVLLPR